MTWVMNPFGLGSQLKLGAFRLISLKEDLNCGIKRFFSTILSFTKNVQKMLFSWAGKGILLFWLSKRHLGASYIYTEWRAINLKGVSPSFIAVILSLCPTPEGWPCFRFACCLYCHLSCAASARKERKASIYRWQQLNYLQTVVSSGHFSSLPRSVIFSSTGCFFFSAKISFGDAKRAFEEWLSWPEPHT